MDQRSVERVSRHGRRRWGRSGALGLAPLWLAACAQLLSVEDACEVNTPGCAQQQVRSPVKPNEPDAGGEETCSRYCELIANKCQKTDDRDNRQYPSDSECQSLCPFMPKASEGAAGGNTLACRISYAQNPETEPEIDCPIAGRSGGGECGTQCEVYCSLMMQVCPAWFELEVGCNCVEDCELNLKDDPAGYLVPFDDRKGTVQCRLWHVGAAANNGAPDNEPMNVHCKHAAGRAPCGDVPVNAMPQPTF
jgi:hypothetical protein